MLWRRANYTPFNSVWSDDNKRKILGMMSDTTSVLSGAGIPSMPIYGTLIGIMRHGDLIPWDDDVDIMINSDNYTKLLTMGEEFLSKGLRLIEYKPPFNDHYVKICMEGDTLIRGKNWSWPFIDIFHYRVIGDEVKVYNDRLKYSDVFPVQSNGWLGLDIPAKPNNILSGLYGKEWETTCVSSSYNHLHEIQNKRSYSVKCSNIQNNIQYDDLWDNVWVINLDRDTHRWNTTKERLGSIGIIPNRWSATDAKTPEIKALYAKYITKRPLWKWAKFLKPLSVVLTINEFACYMSHLKLWQHIQKGGKRNVLILEDDIIMAPTINKETIQRVVDDSKGFDIVLLGHMKTKLLLPTNNSSVGSSLLTHAYVISGSSLDSLIDGGTNILKKLDWYTVAFCKKNLCYVSGHVDHPTRNTFGNGIIHQDRDEHGSNLRYMKSKRKKITE